MGILVTMLRSMTGGDACHYAKENSMVLEGELEALSFV